MRPTRLRTLLATGAALLLGAPAPALVIDSFESGAFEVSDATGDTAATFGEQSGLANADVVGGVRLVRVLASGLNGRAVASLVPAPLLDDGASLRVESLTGIGLVEATGTYHFIYDGIANGAFDGSAGALDLDLSALDHFTFTVSSLLPVTATSQITLFSSTGQQASPAQALVTGDNLVSLGVFGSLDLADIQGIRLAIDGVQLSDTPILTGFSVVVPEPGTALLLCAGLLGLAGRARARR